MNIIQDKLGNEFLRSNGSMDSNFGAGMIMFSHLPPVASFTRLSAHSVMQEFPPQDLILKKERDSPDCSVGSQGGHQGGAAAVGDYVHSMGIKQEKQSEHDYRLPLYPGGLGRSGEVLEVTVGNHQKLLVCDLNIGNLSNQLEKEATGRKGRRSNIDGHEGKPRKKRSEAKHAVTDADGGGLSPGTKPHICEHCSASFRSSYHLRRHVLIHTGERPFRCSQCNMSFIQKYLLQRHEKIHSGEKPFGCDQCNMRFIQKYHMERHKRTHSGEKPYRCETCQQYFSRTDRLLKHKRTCGEGIKKGLDPGMMDLGFVDMGQGSYGITQGNVGSTGRKKGKSKSSTVGGERKKKKGDPKESHVHGVVSGGYSIYEYSVESPTVSSSTEPGPSMQQGHQGQGPKMAFKKANRKSLTKAGLGQVKAEMLEQGDLGLMQSNETKVESTSSNYDDAMQFVKKRRYLQATNNATPSGAAVAGGGGSDYDVSVHLSSQPSSLQGGIPGVMDSDGPLNLEKSGITDEVLHSLLDLYTQKPDIHFDIGDQHVQLSPASADGSDANAPSPSGDKSSMMHEYSRFLLQALERTSHSAGFPLGPGPLPSSGPFTTSHAGNPLYADKNIYSASHLECGFVQPVASPSLPSSVPKSHFAMLSCSSPQHSFNLSSLEAPSHQQLTPSQELTEQMEKQHSTTPPSTYQISPSDLSNQKEHPAVKSDSAAVYPLVPSQDLASLDSSKPSYQIENFAQAFGSQFKSDVHGLSYSTESGGEVDHRIRTPVSDFSGYSLLSDVNEPVSTGSKTPTSQSYR
ncbi:zinc finger protein 281 [Poecilia latipinna]|uniref:Zinc finger protein 281 n=1 Tax=Poecilia latipinna TaxID=48699 RepID=A0A3B3V3X8_9TELE|nr:PREDICTED: zinc finger protein 281-like [Poecilia latipinna]